MGPKAATLKNDCLSAEILLDWGYTRSRYDWGGTVGQVTRDGHRYLSRELHRDGGVGLGGVGLTNVFEWRDTALFERTQIGDDFPLLGVGLLRRNDSSPFLFTRDYGVTPFERVVRCAEDSVSIRTLPHLCQGTAVDMTKRYSLSGETLLVEFLIRNTGRNAVHATEFCHNFVRFDDREIDSSYRVSFPYSLEAKARRGQLILERDAYRLGEFDGPTDSSAFWIRGWEGLQSHWMKIENEELGMGLLVEDEFPVCDFYSWNNFNAICPEVFAPIDLAPGQAVSYRRKYSFLLT